MKISKNIKKTDDMEKYEQETGKKAIWNDEVTEGFKKWLKGEKIYEQDKERITLLVSEDIKNEWQDFMKTQRFSTLSKMIRKAVNHYIKDISNQVSVKTIKKLSHNLKEPLTTIKGYTHLLIENYKDKLEWDVLSKIKDVYDQSIILEKAIDDALGTSKKETIDILIVDDDILTNRVLNDIFKMKGYSTKTATSGSEALKIIERITPKIILLDIILPEVNGYEICTKIKEQERYKDLIIYFITAVPRAEVEREIKETGANGFFLKPFDFSEFEIIDETLSKTQLI